MTGKQKETSYRTDGKHCSNHLSIRSQGFKGTRRVCVTCCSVERLQERERERRRNKERERERERAPATSKHVITREVEERLTHHCLSCPPTETGASLRATLSLASDFSSVCVGGCGGSCVQAIDRHASSNEAKHSPWPRVHLPP